MAPEAHSRQPQQATDLAVAGDADDGQPSGGDAAVLIDCDRCTVRGAGCSDCVVTFLLGGPPDDVLLDPDEQRALNVLASAGLVPPLRMVEAVDSRMRDDPP
jgi:hypothetical protein